MNITIDKQAGFCPGVKKAIEIAEESLSKGKSITSLGQLIHNENEISRLEKLGLNILDQEDVETDFQKLDEFKNKDDVILIRSHGVAPKIIQQLKEKEIKYIDATCPRVIRSQKIIQDYYEKGYQIVIVGKHHHPEVKSLMGFCNNQAVVVLNKNDINKIEFNKKTLLLAQTTIGEDIYEFFAKNLKKGVIELVNQKTICPVVSNRIQQIMKLAKCHDVVILVAGQNSSNSKVLFDVCLQHNNRSHFITGIDELDWTWFKVATSVCITGGASTPIWQLNHIKQLILHKHLF